MAKCQKCGRESATQVGFSLDGDALAPRLCIPCLEELQRVEEVKR